MKYRRNNLRNLRYLRLRKLTSFQLEATDYSFIRWHLVTSKCKCKCVNLSKQWPEVDSIAHRFLPSFLLAQVKLNSPHVLFMMRLPLTLSSTTNTVIRSSCYGGVGPLRQLSTPAATAATPAMTRVSEVSLSWQPIMIIYIKAKHHHHNCSIFFNLLCWA